MGGSGGSSGAVSHSAYLETVHNDWLDNTGVDTITSSMTDVMNSALGNSPWTAQSPYDPDTDITAFETAVSDFATILAGLSDTVDWAALFVQAETSLGTPTTLAVSDASVSDIADTTDVAGITDSIIDDDIDAFADQLDDQISNVVLPRFQRGMQDINAVVSSAFVIGASTIEGFRNRDVTKHGSALRIAAAEKNADIGIANEQLHLEVKKTNISKDVEVARMNLDKDIRVGGINVNVDVEYKKAYLTGTDQLTQLMRSRINWEENYMKTVIEANRIKIVAKQEENEIEMKIDEYDAIWDLEVFKFGGNLLAAISGGVATGVKPSAAQSAIGGALSGAAAGAMVGSAVPGIGTAVGAGIGGLLGAASAFL